MRLLNDEEESFHEQFVKSMKPPGPLLINCGEFEVMLDYYQHTARAVTFLRVPHFM